MPRETSGDSSSVVWMGKPWIFPGLVSRSMLIIVAAVVVYWLEFSFSGVTDEKFLNIMLPLWTSLVIFLIWVFSLAHLLLIRASNTYVLRNDGLQVTSGIFSSTSYAVAAAGFSDLEVTRSISARIVNSGDIIIRTQGQRDVMMERVRNPLEVADKIRGVMSRPIVRIEGQDASEEKK